MMKKNKEIHQGDIYIVSLKDTVGSEQSLNGRPCLIIQNEVGNKYSGTTLIIPLTKKNKKQMPTHYLLLKERYSFLEYDSLVLGEQIRCVDINKRILERKLGSIKEDDLKNIIDIVYKNF